jgi:putative glutamine amidotransferase
LIKIGVSACFFYPDPNRAYFGPKTLCYLENDMANYLFKEDVLPILIPDLSDRLLEIFLSHMDGFVLQGGADISPESYAEAFLNKEKWPGDKQRDIYELKIIDYAFKNAKPLFGICRGAQLLNVYFGGTLYQDLQTEYSASLKHRDATKYDSNYHAIQFTSGNLLNTIYSNEKNPHVCSVHHQGIKKLGNELIIEAICTADKLIEAFSYERMTEHFILGVQWHPEYSYTLKHKLIPADPIYHYFLNAVRTSRSL